MPFQFLILAFHNSVDPGPIPARKGRSRAFTSTSWIRTRERLREIIKKFSKISMVYRGTLCSMYMYYVGHTRHKMCYTQKYLLQCTSVKLTKLVRSCDLVKSFSTLLLPAASITFWKPRTKLNFNYPSHQHILFTFFYFLCVEQVLSFISSPWSKLKKKQSKKVCQKAKKKALAFFYQELLVL